MSMLDLIDKANDLATDFIATMDHVYADKAGLDERCGFIYVGSDCIGVDTDQRHSLDYYGGFEYVSKSDVFVVGKFTFYSIEDDRVAGHIEVYFEGKN